jgi:choline dehydrogenase-like flavoprotein
MHSSHSFGIFGALVLSLILLSVDLSSAVLFSATSDNISNRTYDYIVAGCGISGIGVAARLSEDPNITVLCIEAGPLDQGEDLIKYPVYIGAQPPCFYEWCLDSTPQNQLDGATRHIPMGRGVGGGSLINGMLWNRGGQVDFESWEQLGNPGWSWDDILPYFKQASLLTSPLIMTTNSSVVRELHSQVVRRTECQQLRYHRFVQPRRAWLLRTDSGFVS